MKKGQEAEDVKEAIGLLVAHNGCLKLTTHETYQRILNYLLERLR